MDRVAGQVQTPPFPGVPRINADDFPDWAQNRRARPC